MFIKTFLYLLLCAAYLECSTSVPVLRDDVDPLVTGLEDGDVRTVNTIQEIRSHDMTNDSYEFSISEDDITKSKEKQSKKQDLRQSYEELEAQHVGQTKNAAPEDNGTAESGRDDSSRILMYSVPVTAVAFVIVCVAVVIRCRSIRADQKKKFGPGTEFTLGAVFRRNKIKGFHRLSTTDSDTEDLSEGSIF
ncbi:uncharacterized protein LOC100377603 [Saccoglossus kowalevskii]|uniref:Uncharacterized protein LOC100377603 n=1 Tax=Saccoglossus kowalevskii TaxID=10224 RepID=A0ABM0GIM3_SACKO|nr:PREDICTED: uncharacterized protein LOC100377603 [Saccoglossus kowalevskii]